MSVAYIAGALTTLDTVKALVGTSAGDADVYRAINVASQLVARYIGRALHYQAITEESQAGSGGCSLWVDVVPLLTITGILEDGAALSSSVYEIADASTGEVARIDGGVWSWVGQRWNNIRHDPVYTEPDPDYYQVSYTGGYVLPKDAVAASLGSDAETFDFSGGKSLTLMTDEGVTTVTFVDGDFGTPSAATADEVVTVIDAALGDDMSVAASGGVVTVTRSGDFVDNTLRASGTAATALGLSTDQQVGTRTLPYDIEQAAIQLSVYTYRQRASTGESIRSEKLLSYSVTYDRGVGVPSQVAAILDSYRGYH